MCYLEQRKRSESMANRTICNKVHKKKVYFLNSFPAGRGIKVFPGPPFKIASLAVQPPTLNPLRSPWLVGN